MRTVGKLPCSGIILPIFVRLVPMGTATIMQRAALLQARPPPYSAVGGESTLFGGYTTHLCAIGIISTYGHSSEQHYCRRDRPPLVRSVGKLLCSCVVLTLSFDWHIHVQSFTVPPPPTLLLGRMQPVFFSYGWRRDPLLCYPSLHCCATPPYTTVGADAARFLYGWLRDLLLRYPPTHCN